MPRKTSDPVLFLFQSVDRFNEAAARCRGKPGSTVFDSQEKQGFNEAAARCRGKPGYDDGYDGGLQPGFNEAAARCRGKPSFVAASISIVAELQ